jgi:hypothetical protein
MNTSESVLKRSSSNHISSRADNRGPIPRRAPDNAEVRCIATGLCLSGPVVCINTRQLKKFLNRCKSSINGSFQQLGYIAVRTKSKARNCCVAALPALASDQTVLRQHEATAPRVSFKPKLLENDLPTIGDFEDSESSRAEGPVPLSFSMDCFRGLPHVSFDCVLR